MFVYVVRALIAIALLFVTLALLIPLFCEARHAAAPVVVATGGTISIWEENGVVTATCSDGAGVQITHLPDGTYVASAY